MGVTTAIVAGGLVAAGTIGAAAIMSDASKKASNAQAEAAAAARQDMAPWRVEGEQALTQVGKILRGEVGVETSPGYQFRYGEGIRALDQSAASRGKLLSGGQQKAVTQYGQNVASQEYQNWLNNWYRLAEMGQGAAATSGQQTMAQGEATAAGQMAQGQIWGNALQTIGNLGAQAYMGYNYRGMGQGQQQQNPYMNQLAANRNALNQQTGYRYAYGL